MTPFTECTQDRQTARDKAGERGRNEGLLFNGCRVSIWDDEKYLEIDSGDD